MRTLSRSPRLAGRGGGPGGWSSSHAGGQGGGVSRAWRDETSAQAGEGADGPRVGPAQLFGIEVDRSAVEVAEAVLCVGGRANIEHRDAVLAWDFIEVVEGTGGRGRVSRYVNPRKAEWPRADFIVGNPPFMGKLRLRRALGEAYASALRQAYAGEVPPSADYAMYWWSRAARAVATGSARRFGLITPSSITQRYSRSVVARALSADPPVELVLALPDEAWAEGGAEVRIAMTVGQAASARPRTASVSADLTRSLDVSSATRLRANRGISHVGVGLHGKGFALEADAARRLLAKAAAAGIEAPERFIRPIESGHDLARTPRGRFVIDLFGVAEWRLTWRQSFRPRLSII